MDISYLNLKVYLNTKTFIWWSVQPLYSAPKTAHQNVSRPVLGDLIRLSILKNAKGHWGHRDKGLYEGSGSPVCQGWQMLRRDWPVPARMGFAVNKSQLVQSEWKETAQKGYFVSATVCQAGGKNKTQSPALSSHPTWPSQILWGQINLGFRLVVASLCWHTLQHGGFIVTAFNVAADVNIAFCIAFMFLNSTLWPELLPDTNVSSRAFQIAHKHSRNLTSRLQFIWNVIPVRRNGCWLIFGK